MMTKPMQDEQQQESERQLREQKNAKIGEGVMHTLGQPHDLRAVQVRPLWKDHYRVNVLVGVDIASVKVAHSFFLVSDLNGAIVASTPAIRKQY